MFPEDIIGRIVPIKKIITESLTIDEPFMALAARFAHLPGTVALLSGGELDCARHHILALFPWLHLRDGANGLKLELEEDSFEIKADPLYALKTIMAAAGNDLFAASGPVEAGFFGYLSYDLKDRLERLPRTTLDDLNLPDICFYAPSLIVVEDIFEKSRTLYRTVIDEASANRRYERFRRILKEPPPQIQPFCGQPETFQSNFERRDYLTALEKLHEYIAAGHIYQANMSQRFSMQYSGSGFELFERLFKMNPAPFFAYINAGDHEIVSTSPERFLSQKGDKLETRPIKGTRKRGANAKEDQALRRELLESAKEEAELSMIVDLMRNDLGRVCEKQTVKVAEHKRVEAYENVFHLISIVTGKLAEGRDAADVIAATFPGGSITGCPKVRAMEIIDELEPTCRHLYTGAIGYISLHRTMDLSIAIRTATLTKGRIHFGVGGGIVFDSVPQAEFEETLHKGKTLMAACLGRDNTFSASHKAEDKPARVWFNGKMMDANQAKIPISHAGFQYGYGFFETILAENGQPCRLEDHLERFFGSWKTLYQCEPPQLSWREIIISVLEANHLARQTAAVKIMTALAGDDSPPYHPHLAVTTRPYTHRLEVLGKKGLNLGIYPHPRQSPLADHKTLNYLYYFQAGKWAKANGFDEAIILNPDGSISETNTGNIFVVKGKKLIQPDSGHVLPGIMAKSIKEVAEKEGFEVTRKVLTKEDLPAADQVWVTNALMGVVPVLGVEKTKLNFVPDLLERIQKRAVSYL